MFLNVFLIHTNHQLHQVSKAVDYFKIPSGTIIIVNFRDNQEKSVIKPPTNVPLKIIDTTLLEKRQ